MAEQQTIEPYQAADVAYDVAMRRLDEQMRQVDAIDNKVTFFITVSTTITGLFAGFAAVTVDTDQPWSIGTAIAFIVMVALMYSFVMMFGFWGVFGFYKWDVRPNWDELLTYSREYPNSLVRSWVADACVRSLKANATGLDRKLYRAGVAARFLSSAGINSSSRSHGDPHS